VSVSDASALLVLVYACLLCPGAFFAEFLPQRIKVPQAVSNFKTSFSDKHAPSGKPGAAADACLPAQQPSSQQQQQQKPTGQANGSAQPSQARQTGAAGAAADAKASAAAAATAAAAAAARAAKQAEAADKQAALRLKAKVDAAVAVQDEAAGDSESGDLLPSLSEIRSAMAAAWFGDEDEEGGSSSKERAGHKEAGEEEPASHAAGGQQSRSLSDSSWQNRWGGCAGVGSTLFCSWCKQPAAKAPTVAQNAHGAGGAASHPTSTLC
jgi:hypothetical protein